MYSSITRSLLRVITPVLQRAQHSVLYCAKGFSVLVWLVRVPQPPAGSADASVCASLEWTRFVRLEGTPLVTGLVHLSSSPFEFASAEKEKDSEAGQEVSGERAERRGEEADAGGGRSLTLIACGSTHSLHRVCVQWTTDTADESIGGCSGSGCSVLHLELLDSAEPTSKPVARQSRFLNLRSSASGVLLYLLDEWYVSLNVEVESLYRLSNFSKVLTNYDPRLILNVKIQSYFDCTVSSPNYWQSFAIRSSITLITSMGITCITGSYIRNLAVHTVI